MERHGETKGKSPSKLYMTWCNIIARCENEKTDRCGLYFHIGISVCKEWRMSFIIFRDWSLSHGYQEGLEIDRKDPDGNYCPDNCRWVTQQQNNWNTRARAGSTSKYKGVYLSENRWIANITYNGKRRKLGFFHNEEDAAHRYDFEAIKLFGEYARLNFPDYDYNKYIIPEQSDFQKTTSSHFHNVAFNKQKNKYCAYININKKRVHLGDFENEFDAAYEYNKKAVELYGDKAKLNKLPEDFLQNHKDILTDG